MWQTALIIYLALWNTVYDFMNKTVNRQKGNTNEKKTTTTTTLFLYNVLLVFATTELAFSKTILDVETPLFIP